MHNLVVWFFSYHTIYLRNFFFFFINELIINPVFVSERNVYYTNIKHKKKTPKKKRKKQKENP